MDIHGKPIQQRIDWLFDLADRHGANYRSPEAWLARERYLAEHPTAIAALKCMDGRINISVATNTPVGILIPFRNLGGMFDLGWPHLGEVLAHHVQRIVGRGRRAIFFITYHFSKGDPARGCAGFNFDTEAAIAHTHAIREQFEFMFGHGHGTVYPILVGFETDEDALILHGRDGGVLNLAEFSPGDDDSLRHWLARLYPDMAAQMREDLMPLLKGNLERIAQVRNTNRGVLHLSVEGDTQEPALDLSYDVGAVTVGLRKELIVRATNVGSDPMNVLGVSLGTSGNGSWFVRDVTAALSPGASVTATVTFAPAGLGAQATQVTFSHNADAALPSLRLSGTGS